MSSLLRRSTPVMLMAAVLIFFAHATAHAAPSSDAADRCGALEIGSPASTSDQAQARFSCFTAALQTCDPVSLIVSAHTADAVVTRTFATQMGERACAIVETVDRSANGKTSTDTNICQEARRNKDGLAFSRCGQDGDVTVPEVPTADAIAAFIKART